MMHKLKYSLVAVACISLTSSTPMEKSLVRSNSESLSLGSTQHSELTKLDKSRRNSYPLATKSYKEKKKKKDKTANTLLIKQQNMCISKALPEISKQGSTISLKTHITPENMTYTKHWSGPHSPKKFSIAINGTPLSLSDKFTGSENLTIPLKANNNLEVSYTYDFGWGHKGTNTLIFEIPQDMEQAQIEFAWDNPPLHVTIPGAKLIEQKGSKK